MRGLCQKFRAVRQCHGVCKNPPKVQFDFQDKKRLFEYDSLFIILKTGQKTDKCDIPALRADVLMNLIAPDTLFNIERIRFFDSDMREL